MIFQPALAGDVLSGRKTVTRRLVSDNPRSPWWKERCALNVGQDYAVCPGRGKAAIGRVEILSVRQERLGDALGDADHRTTNTIEALREGFLGVPAFKRTWARINGTWDPDARVWRVEFKTSGRK